MTQLIKYEPWTIIETWDGDLYYLNKKLEAVYQAKQKHGEIFLSEHGVVLSSKNIKKIYEDKQGIAGMTPDQMTRLANRKKEFKSNIGREPSDAEVQKMASKIKQL